MVMSSMYCGPLASSICMALPSELRNQIYDYVVQGSASSNTVYIKPHLLPSERRRLSPMHDGAVVPFWSVYTRCPTECFAIPHFLDWEVVGKQFAREATITFLGCMDFEVTHQDDVGPFLTQRLHAFGPALSLRISLIALCTAVARAAIDGDGGEVFASRGFVPKTRRVGTRPLGPAVSLTALTAI